MNLIRHWLWFIVILLVWRMLFPARCALYVGDLYPALHMNRVHTGRIRRFDICIQIVSDNQCLAPARPVPLQRILDKTSLWFPDDDGSDAGSTGYKGPKRSIARQKSVF